MIQIDKKAALGATAVTAAAATSEAAVISVTTDTVIHFETGDDFTVGETVQTTFTVNTNAPSEFESVDFIFNTQATGQTVVTGSNISFQLDQGDLTIDNNPQGDTINFDAFDTDNASFSAQTNFISSDTGPDSEPLASANIQDGIDAFGLFDLRTASFSTDTSTAEGEIVSFSTTTLSDLVGNYDGDDDVDIDDFNFWSSNFGSNNPQADGNRDGVVSAADFTLWRDNVNVEQTQALVSTASSYGTSVPEPTGGLLTGIAAAGFAIYALFSRKR